MSSIDRDSLIFTAGYLFARKRLLAERKSGQLPVSKQIERTLNLLGDHPASRIANDATTPEVDQKEPKTELISCPIADRLIFYPLEKSRFDEGILDDIQSVDSEWVKSRKALVKDEIRYNAYKGREGENSWSKTQIPEIIGRIIEFIRLASRKELASMIDKESITSCEVDAGLELVDKILEQPEYNTLLDIYEQVVKKVGKNQDKYLGPLNP